jgi:hypothetical protein
VSNTFRTGFLYVPYVILVFFFERKRENQNKDDQTEGKTRVSIEFPEGIEFPEAPTTHGHDNDEHYDGTVYHFYIENRDGTLFPVTGHFWTYKFLVHCN